MANKLFGFFDGVEPELIEPDANTVSLDDTTDADAVAVWVAGEGDTEAE